jgi:hypothetical protein
MGSLAGLAPVSEGYATLPVAEAFNWTQATTDLGTGSWYLVAFRSVRQAGANEERLALYDEFAHQEAAGCPGFVHYFKGPAGADGSCLSFCLWNTREDARIAAAKPAHARAVSLIGEMYASYELEFLQVTRTAEGRLAFEPYGHHEVQPSRGAHPAPRTSPSYSIEPSAAS